MFVWGQWTTQFGKTMHLDDNAMGTWAMKWEHDISFFASRVFFIFWIVANATGIFRECYLKQLRGQFLPSTKHRQENHTPLLQERVSHFPFAVWFDCVTIISSNVVADLPLLLLLLLPSTIITVVVTYVRR